MSEYLNETAITRADKSYDRHNDKFMGFIRLSSAYGLLAVRSSFLLNGAALFALPPVYISLIKDIPAASASDLFWPALMFVLGIAFAALCSFVAYVNFQLLAYQSMYDAHLEFVSIKEIYDPAHFNKSRDFYTKYREENQPVSDRYQFWIKGTAWAGVVLGTASYICFLLGCQFSGGVLFN